MARLLAALIVLFPLSFIRVDQRGAAFSPMVIQLETNSPAFAAFEDLQNNYEDPIQEVAPQQEVIQLATGKVYRPSLPEVQPMTIVALKAMKISSGAPEEASSLQTKMATYTPPAVEPRNSSFKWDMIDQGKSLSERKKETLAQLSKEDLKMPSVGEKAGELVQEALKNHRPDRRELPTLAGGTIIIKKPASSAEDASPYIRRRAPAGDAAREVAHNEGKILVRGRVMITGGIPDMGEFSRWRLYRQFDGQPQESGSVNATEAEFSIRVGERKGQIVAELSDRYGQVYGRGKAALTDGEVALNVRPVETASVAAVYGSSEDVSHYIGRSRIFMEASAPGHITSIALGFLNQLKHIPLYTGEALKAFASIVQSFYKPVDVNQFATLWGKVLKEGKEVSGALIELASFEGRTVYFNEIGIPRGDLKRTTSSGQFAAVNLSAGVQSVRVSYDGKSYPAQVVPTSAGKITHLNLEIPTRFFDHMIRAFSLVNPEEHITTSLRIVGTEDLYDLTNAKAITLPDLEAGTLVEWDSGPGFEILRAHLPPLPSPTEIELPVASSDWIEGLVAQSGKILDRRLGWAIGFSPEMDAEVNLQNEATGLYEIIFFDENLKLWKGDHVPMGGGFIAFNLPLGYQTLEIRSLHAAQSRAESFVSEPYFLHLVGSERFISVPR